MQRHGIVLIGGASMASEIFRTATCDIPTSVEMVVNVRPEPAYPQILSYFDGPALTTRKPAKDWEQRNYKKPKRRRPRP